MWPLITVSRLLKSCATPAGKLADGLHLLRLPELLLQLQALGDVPPVAHNPMIFPRLSRRGSLLVRMIRSCPPCRFFSSLSIRAVPSRTLSSSARYPAAISAG